MPSPNLGLNMNSFRRRWTNGTNFRINKHPKYYEIVHTPSGASVAFQIEPKYVYISYGNTPKGWTGKGLGTILRAIATMVGIESGKPVYQTGVRVGKLVNGLPISTSILRSRLGWVRKNKGNEWNSVFRKGNNNTKVRQVLSGRNKKIV
jgi:hypothetical protein